MDSFNQGGSERQALQLIRLLNGSARYSVRLASLSADGSLRETIADLDLGEVPSFPLNNFYDQNAIKQLGRFVRWMKSSSVDVVHTHDFYTNIFGMTAGSMARVPVRIASMRETEAMRSITQKKIQRVSYALAHNVVANSNAVRDKLIAEGVSSDKVSVIYNGLDLRRLETELAWEEKLALLGGLPIDRAKCLVSIVANMRHEVKDYPMFLKAAHKVKEAIPNANFLLAGEGELQESLKALARDLGIFESVFFLGRCDHIAELLSISDVCVLSSKAEGFSNSILEYMAAGRPVVATDVGGAREAITEGITGYLVPSGDDALMAQRVIELLREPESARKMGLAGRAVVSSKFSCAAQLSHTENLYDRLLAKRGSTQQRKNA